MTFGSAASLPRSVAEAPLFKPPFVKAVPSTDIGGVLPRGARAGLAVGDPPARKVLVACQHAVTALNLQRLLRGAGYSVLGPVGSAEEADRLIARARIDCAVIEMSADQALVVADMLADEGVPFLFLANEGDPPLRRHASKEVLKRPYRVADLLLALRRTVEGRPSLRRFAETASLPVPWPRIMPQL